MAKEHKLVNNCLGCGRIVWEAEGEGPCSFWANPVLKNENLNEFEEQMKLMKDMEDDPDFIQSYFHAVDHKMKLIEADKEKNMKKNMIDEETDWYELKNNVWESDEVRKHAMDRMIMEEIEEEDTKRTELLEWNFSTGVVSSSYAEFDTTKGKRELKNFLDEQAQKHELKPKEKQMDIDSRLKAKEVELLDSIKEAYLKEHEEKREVKEQEQRKKFGENLSNKVKNDDCYVEFLKAVEKSNLAQNPPEKANKNQFDRPFFELSASDNQ